MASNQFKKAARESYGFLFLIGGILVLLNILGMFFFGRLDMTDKRLFSLSEGSKRLARSLKDNMEITAYFTENLPPPFNATERYVRDILDEYQSASKGKIRVRHVNPNTEDKMSEAEQDGIRKVSHQVIENDGVNVREGFRGIVFKYLGENKTIPVIEDTSGLEYQITQLVKQMVGEKVSVGLMSGHLGPTLEKGLSGLRQSTPTYTLRETSATSDIPKDLHALLVVGPETAISDGELKNIDNYVMNGGSVGIFGGGVKLNAEGQDPTATHVETNLNKLLAGWGLKFGKEFVADAQCGRAPMQTMFGLQVLVPYPLVPIISLEAAQSEHPALFKINQIGMPFVTPVNLLSKDKPKGYKRTVLAKSSKQSWLIEGENLSIKPKPPREWAQTGKGGPFSLAVALEGSLPSGLGEAGKKSSKPARVLVAGSAGFMRDEFLPRADEQGQRDLTSALAFALNSIDWLAQDSDLIAIRAKNIEDAALEVPSPVMEAEHDIQSAAQGQDKAKVEEALEKRKSALKAWDVKKAGYRWFNTLGLPLIFALFGLARWRSRKTNKVTL